MTLDVVRRLWFWIVVTGALVAAGWLMSVGTGETTAPYDDRFLPTFGWFSVLAGTPVFLFFCALAAEDLLTRRAESQPD